MNFKYNTNESENGNTEGKKLCENKERYKWKELEWQELFL